MELGPFDLPSVDLELLAEGGVLDEEVGTRVDGGPDDGQGWKQ